MIRGVSGGAPSEGTKNRQKTMTDPMSRLLKLAAPIFFVCFTLSVSAARPQLPPAWEGASAHFDSRTYAYLPPVRIVAQEHADLIAGGDLLLEPGNGQGRPAERPHLRAPQRRRPPSGPAARFRT